MRRNLSIITLLSCILLAACTTTPPSGNGTGTTSTTEPSGPVQLIVAGDSLSAMPPTYNISATWPGLLYYPVANTARGGAAFTYVNSNIPTIGTSLKAYITDNGCDKPVVVVGGTNDFRVKVTADSVQATVQQLAIWLTTHSCETLWVTTVPTPNATWNAERSEWNRRLISGEVNLANGFVADCSTLEGEDGLTAPEYVLKGDSLHLNQAGQYALEDCITQSLQANSLI